MKTYKILLVFFALSIIFAGCSGGSEKSFTRPFDDFEGFSVKRFKGEKLVNINVPVKDGFEWVPGSKITGYLTFDLVFTTRKDKNWKKREINLTIKIQDDLILALDLDKNAFFKEDSNLKFRKSIKAAVSLGNSDKLSFSIKDSGGSNGDNFDLISLVIVPDKGPDHKKNKNILLITIDTLRADYLGYYRKLKELYPDKISFSPNLDRIAEENLIFTNAYTPIASTWPALSSIARSRMPFEHGVQNNGDQLEKEESSLGHHLFNEWFSVSYRANAFQLDIGGFDVVKSFFRKDKKLKNSAKVFLVENYKKKFFLWLHFLGVHSGYRPSKEILARIEPEEYTGNVHKAVGPVLKKITAGERKVTEYDIEHIRNCYAG
ncbi:MAG: sulfatase-like hydrolase/transferase, partial [Candidatus Aminicenantes bacterium]|nr:sulfatase-like hydrolase/transferase [Candidatus Aminicenantes bacterium]